MQFTICVYDNAASRLSVVVCPASSPEFGGRVGRLVNGSQPSLARRVRKAPAMIVRRPLLVGTTRQVSFTDHLAFSGPETNQRGLMTVCEMVRKRDQTASRASQTRDPGPATLADRPLSGTVATERPWHARRPF